MKGDRSYFLTNFTQGLDLILRFRIVLVNGNPEIGNGNEDFLGKVNAVARGIGILIFFF